MAYLFLLLTVVAVALAVASLFKPKLAAWAKAKSRGWAFTSYLGVALVCLIGMVATIPDKYAAAPVASDPAPAPVQAAAPGEPKREEYRTVGGLPACLSEQALEEAEKAWGNRDAQWFDSIKGCVIVDPGLKVVYLDRGILTSKVRIFDAKGGSVVVWTGSENVAKLK